MVAHRSAPAALDPAVGAGRRRPFLDAWAEAAYGPEGFWRRHTPGAHFRTAASSVAFFVELVERLVELAGASQVVDIGAGSGELLTALHARRPELRLTGVDLRDRPGQLPAEVAWVSDLWDVRQGRWQHGAATALLGTLDRHGLIVATEWLDDLPCPVATRHDGRWREIVLDDLGRAAPGPPLAAADATWADRWWPTGDVTEIGLTRDRAWADLVGHAVRVGGSALLVDYGHERARRPVAGSLAGYRCGRVAAPRPCPEANLTAHVAVDALRVAGESRGAVTALYAPQREAVRRLLPAESREPPGDPLADLVRRGERRLLSSATGWGNHWWLWQTAPSGRAH